jgi:hypothetical protein
MLREGTLRAEHRSGGHRGTGKADRRVVMRLFEYSMTVIPLRAPEEI